MDHAAFLATLRQLQDELAMENPSLFPPGMDERVRDLEREYRLHLAAEQLLTGIDLNPAEEPGPVDQSDITEDDGIITGNSISRVWAKIRTAAAVYE